MKYTTINTTNNNINKRNINYEAKASNKRIKYSDKNISKLNEENNIYRELYNFKDIFNLKDTEQWMEALNEELKNMEKLNVFQIVNSVPEGSNVISSRWVFKYKRDSYGNIIKRKARLVAKGYT